MISVLTALALVSKLLFATDFTMLVVKEESKMDASPKERYLLRTGSSTPLSSNSEIELMRLCLYSQMSKLNVTDAEDQADEI